MYFTVHYEHQGSNLDKYPDVFNDNVCIVVYRVDGITDHVNSKIYKAHRAYEIEKSQM